jgi:hypothetical protein
MAAMPNKPPKIPAALLARYRAGELHLNALAKILHTHQGKISRELQRLGVDTSQSGRLSLAFARQRGFKGAAAMHAKVCALYAKGLALRPVARQTGLSAPGVLQILRRYGVRIRRRKRR